jgi:hypothetical protein
MTRPGFPGFTTHGNSLPSSLSPSTYLPQANRIQSALLCCISVRNTVTLVLFSALAFPDLRSVLISHTAHSCYTSRPITREADKDAMPSVFVLMLGCSIHSTSAAVGSIRKTLPNAAWNADSRLLQNPPAHYPVALLKQSVNRPMFAK